MANNNIYNNKLTPSAIEELNNTMLEIQEMLIDKANSVAQKGQASDKEISLRDILEAKDILFKTKIKRENEYNRRKKLMTMIALVGALYSILGLTFYMYQNQNFFFGKGIGLLMAITGIIIILTGFVYTKILSRNYEEQIIKSEFISSVNDFEIIKRWQIIEKLGSNLMVKKGYSPNKSKSINDILKFLSIELKNESLYIEMKELLTIRNKILHEGYELTRNEKQSYLENANEIIELLETLEK